MNPPVELLTVVGVKEWYREKGGNGTRFCPPLFQRITQRNATEPGRRVRGEAKSVRAVWSASGGGETVNRMGALVWLIKVSGDTTDETESQDGESVKHTIYTVPSVLARHARGVVLVVVVVGPPGPPSYEGE